MNLYAIALIALLLSRRVRVRHRLSALSLPLPHHSAWEALWQSQSDGGLIQTTGFDIPTFHIIHDAVAPYIYTFGHGRGGRQPRLDTYAATALALHYLRSTIPLHSLCQIFSSPPATTQRTLMRTLYAMFKALPNLPLARIRWPSQDEMEMYSQMIRNREPTLHHCFGFVDGVWMQVMSPSDQEQQNAYWNGWKNCTNISNVICFAPDGCIIWARYNCPGSWHDANVAKPLLELLDSLRTPHPYHLIADSGFPSSPKIKTPYKNGQLSADPMIAAVQVANHRSVTSVRQAAEWGMRVLQGGFQRLHTVLPYHPALREIILVCCFHLLNLRTRAMGINQIRTVFDSSYIPNIFVDKDASFLHRFYDVQ